MTACRVTPRCTALFLLLAMAGGGWCQTQLLDPEPRTCRTQDNADDASALSQGHRNEYPAGGILMVLAKVPAGLFGSLQVFLCPDGEAPDECLDRVPLQLADGSGTNYNLQDVSRTDSYEIPVILPDDITCTTCTLQLRALTRDCADQDDCPEAEQTFCSDITVREIKTPQRRDLADVGRGMALLGRCLTCIGNIVIRLAEEREGFNNDLTTRMFGMICSVLEQFCSQQPRAIEAPPGGRMQDSARVKKGKKKRKPKLRN